jgi:hypothetical protein
MRLKAGVAVEIVSVKTMGGYRLSLTFSDGHVSTVDFGPFLRTSQNPETRAFLDGKRFRSHLLHHGNLVWGDYEMCFPIEDLYDGCINHDESAQRAVAVAEPRARYGTRMRKRT